MNEAKSKIKVTELNVITMPSRKERVSFVISEEEKRILEKLAAIDNRTVSNYLLTLIRKDIARATREGGLDEAS